MRFLATKAVQGAALSLQCVYDVERGNGLALFLVSKHGGKKRRFRKPLRVQCTRNVSMFANLKTNRQLTVTASRMTLSRKDFRTPRVSS